MITVIRIKLPSIHRHGHLQILIDTRIVTRGNIRLRRRDVVYLPDNKYVRAFFKLLFTTCTHPEQTDWKEDLHSPSGRCRAFFHF